MFLLHLEYGRREDNIFTNCNDCSHSFRAFIAAATTAFAQSEVPREKAYTSGRTVGRDAMPAGSTPGVVGGGTSAEGASAAGANGGAGAARADVAGAGAGGAGGANGGGSAGVGSGGR